MELKMILLDRDGVINRDPGTYTYEWDKFEVLPGVFEAIKTWKGQQLKVAVITNQGGISKGIYSPATVRKIHNWFQFELKKRTGVSIDKFYFCPHHSDLENCLCRKPKSLMLEKAMADFEVTPDQVVFLGDSDRDVEAAKAVGVRGVKVPRNGDLTQQLEL